MKAQIEQAKRKAKGIILDKKEKGEIPELSKSLNMDLSWFYKVAKGKVKPSYERALIIIEAASSDDRNSH